MLTCRLVFSAIVAALCIVLGATAADAVFFGGGVSTGSGSLSTTIQLVNDSGSTMAAGTPTQTIGMGFRKGEVPSNSAPVLTNPSNGHVQGYSWGLATYWTDGSLKRVTVMPIPDFSVAGSGSKTLNVTASTGTSLCKTDGTAGGPWPCPSVRTITEVYNQGLVVAMPPAPITNSGLSGVTYKSWLDSAANTNNNNYKVVKWLDGDAGAAWRISTKMASTKTGTAHSFLRFDYYIMALNNSTGGLGAFRWMGFVRNPYYNSGAGTPQFYAFDTPDYVTPANGPNWSVNGGTGTPLGWHGGDNNPMVPQAVTTTATCVWAGSPCLMTTASNNWWFGIGSQQRLPGYYTTTGSLPTTSPQIDLTHIWFVASNQAPVTNYGGSGPNNVLSPLDSPNGGNGISVTNGTGTGTTTFHPIPVIGPFTRIPFATDDGQYNFFTCQVSCGTTLTSETTLRAQFDLVYAQSTHLLPPYDTGVTGASQGGAIVDVTYPWPYNPLSGANSTDNQAPSGVVADIDQLPNAAAVDFYNQSKASLRVVRMKGLMSALGPFDIKDATDTVINLLDTPGTSTYTGLSNSVRDTFQSLPPSFSYPTTFPGSTPLAIAIAAMQDAEHRPNYAYYPFIRTGELQYLDMLEDVAINGMGQVSSCDRNPLTPIAAVGVVTGFGPGGQLRSQAWIYREIAMLAGIYPYDPTATATVYNNGGTQEGAYWRQIVANSTALAAQTMDPANNAYGSATTFITTRGAWLGSASTGGAGCGSTPTGSYNTVYAAWQNGYFIGAMNWAYALLEDANAYTFLTTYATRQNYFLNNFTNGGWFLYQYTAHYGPAYGDNYGFPIITSDSLYAVGGATTRNISWIQNASPSSSSRSFTYTDGGGANTFTPSNGDIIIWNDKSSYDAPMLYQATTNASTSASGNVLHFASTPTGISTPSNPLAGQYVYNATNPSSIGPTTQVLSVSGGDITLLHPVSGTINSGDVIYFSQPIELTALYIVDLVGSDFNLSFTAGGSQLPTLTSGSVSAGNYWVQPKNPPLASAGTQAGNFALEVLGSEMWATALGVPGFGNYASGPIGDGTAELLAGGYDPTTNNTLDNNDVGTGTQCVRLMWQSCFGAQTGGCTRP